MRFRLAFIASAVLMLTHSCIADTIPQTIAFPAIPGKAVDDPPFSVPATATSGLVVTFEGTTPSVCEVTPDGHITIVHTGTCTIKAKQVGGQAGNTTYSAAVDVVQSFTVGTPPGVDAVLGIGSLITGNHTDYKVNSSSNTLEGTQIGRASPQLLLGLSFQLPIKAKPMSAVYPWHAFVSLKFDPQAQESIIGYIFGITYRVQKSLDLLAGYALTPFNEPSPGFKNAVVNVVRSDTTGKYKNFNVNDLVANNPGAYDGFPLQNLSPPTGTPPTNLYSGSALERHYRGGFVIGISVPLSLRSVFKP